MADKDDAALAKAEDRFTHSKEQLDGTPNAEKRYQKAKRDLWKARQKWRRKTYPDKNYPENNAKAKPEALGVTGTPGG